MLDQSDDESESPFGLLGYSGVLYNLHNVQISSSSEPIANGTHTTICQAFVKVKMPTKKDSKYSRHTKCAVKLDTCSSANLCSEALLHDVKPCREHGKPPIRMKMAKGKTPTVREMRCPPRS